MADFCQQCSMDVFGQDFGDLAGLVAPGRCAKVLCEGCGITWVSHDGRCISEDCLEAHGTIPREKKP